MHRFFKIILIVLFPLVGFCQTTKKVLIEGQGLPIIILPGGVVDISAFAPHAKELSANYKIIRMEHFNVQYADEKKILPSNYSVLTESEAIGKTLDSLGIDIPVVVVGASYGAVIALDFALNHSNRIHSLVLFEPPSFWIADLKNEAPNGMEAMKALTAKFTASASITEEDVKKFRCQLLNCDSIDITKLPQWSAWVTQKDRVRGLAATGAYRNTISNLHKFTKPVLLMNGASTVVFHKRINELLAAEFSNVTKKEIPGGHNASVLSSKEFIQALRDFIK
jgi:pimeloyl-ACP methyl ester carboxylesterase